MSSQNNENSSGWLALLVLAVAITATLRYFDNREIRAAMRDIDAEYEDLLSN
jgi:hypothetical protein